MGSVILHQHFQSLTFSDLSRDRYHLDALLVKRAARAQLLQIQQMFVNPTNESLARFSGIY